MPGGAQCASGEGHGTSLLLVSEGVVLGHMLPVWGTSTGVGEPGGRLGRRKLALTRGHSGVVTGGHAADGHQEVTGVQSLVFLGMGRSARSRDTGGADADGAPAA